MIRAAIIALACLAPFAAAGSETIVAGVSHDSIAITADFNGSELLIYGAVKRDGPIPAQVPMGVIITVEGPSAPLTVRHKSREFGIWVNTSSVDVDSAPTFYAVASSAPLGGMLSQTDDLRYRISVPQMIRAIGAASQADDVEAFVQALIKIREASGAYGVLPDAVKISDDTLFSTTIRLPANLSEGEYKTRMFLVRAGRILDQQSALINVHKVGLERWLYLLAYQQPAAYAVLSLVIAAVAGWAAAAAFRQIRR